MIQWQFSLIPPLVPVVLVGPADHTRTIDSLPRNFHRVLENPPGGGPVPGIARALEETLTDLVAVLAIDYPFALPWLLNQELPPHSDAVIARDSEGRDQYLCAIYNTESLTTALHSAGELTGSSMRQIVSALSRVTHPIPSDPDIVLHDIDTPADLARAQIIARSWAPDH